MWYGVAVLFAKSNLLGEGREALTCDSLSWKNLSHSKRALIIFMVLLLFYSQLAHIVIAISYRFPAALSEMLVQNTGSDLYLLPALPRDKWPHGCVKGLKARGGVTVNICWKEGSLHEALLWSSSSQNSLARLRYGGQAATISISPGQVYRFSRDLKCLKTWPLWECACAGFAIWRKNLLRGKFSESSVRTGNSQFR